MIPTLVISLAATAWAASFDPVIEVFRLGQGDQLVIDRGGPVDDLGDVNGDGLDDVIVGAGKGGIRVVYGPTNGYEGRIDATLLQGVGGFVIVGDTENLSVVGGAGDINDDGIDDIVIGTVSGTQVLFGRRSGFPSVVDALSLDGTDGFAFDSPATAVSRAGDVNGDGIDDLLVGDATASPNGVLGAGTSYVIFGHAGAFESSLSPAELDGRNGVAILGIAAGDRSGWSLASAGDFNADGIGDILIGAPRKRIDGVVDVGEAYLLYGAGNGFPPAISLEALDGERGFAFRGNDLQDFTGFAVAGIGDFNHDGIDDIAIGAPGRGPFGIPSDYPGMAHVVFGSTAKTPARLFRADLDGTNGFRIRGIRGGVVPIVEGEAIWGDMAGQSIDRAGDVNGDGIDDLVIGAAQAIINPRRKGSGQAYLVYGSVNAFTPEISLADLDGSNGFRLNGIGTTDYYGHSVSAAGDFNVDGIDDVIIGASGQAESYVFYGRDTGIGRQGQPPLVLLTATPSPWPAATWVPGPVVPIDLGRELADPTGATPLPPGPVTVDPQVEPLEPMNIDGAAGGAGDNSDNDGGGNGPTGNDTQTTDGTGNPVTDDVGSDTQGNPAVAQNSGSGSITTLLLLLLLGRLLYRRSLLQCRVLTQCHLRSRRQVE